MKDNIFCLAGKVNVPAEKKNEMNRHVLEILDKCGIRKTVEMTVAGKKVTAGDFCTTRCRGNCFV